MYRLVHDLFWTDPMVKLWSGQAKLFYIYSFTNPHAHYSGVYNISIETMSREVGLSVSTCTELMEFLTKEDKLMYDQRFEVLFVRNMAKYQFRSNLNNWITGIRKHFNTLHKCPLIVKFAEEYPEFKVNPRDHGCLNEAPTVETPQHEEDFPVEMTKELVVQPLKKKPERIEYVDDIREIISYLNSKANTSFKPKNKDTISHINARMAEGFTKDDFFTVIDHQVAKWLDDEKMYQYLRPQTLFCNKFEGYLNAAPRKRTDKYADLVADLVEDV